MVKWFHFQRSVYFIFKNEYFKISSTRRDKKLIYSYTLQKYTVNESVPEYVMIIRFRVLCTSDLHDF